MQNRLHTLSVIMLLSLSPLIVKAQKSDAEAWINSVGPGFTNDFKNSKPENLPNYQSGVTYSDNPQTIKQQSVSDSQTDEGAQLIYGLGRKPDVKGEKWFQDASNITSDPSTVIDTEDSGYTDCEEVTTPGDEYSSEESCTITAIPETRTCSYGPEVKVDSQYLYECNNELNTTNQTCSVGREIDVTQSHTYQCKVGEEVYQKSCDKKREVTVTFGVIKYEPSSYCEFPETQYSFNHALQTGLSFEQQKWLELYHGVRESYDQKLYFGAAIKLPNQCEVGHVLYAYDRGHYGDDAGDGKEYDKLHEILVSGQKVEGCLKGDELAPDGFCYSEEAMNYTDPIARCPEGTLDGDECKVEPKWVTVHYPRSIATQINRWPNYTGLGYLRSYSPTQPADPLWLAYKDHNGLLFTGTIKANMQNAMSKIVTLTNGSQKMYARLAKLEWQGEQYDEGPRAWHTYYRISVSAHKNAAFIAPVYECGRDEYQVNSQCLSVLPPTEPIITEEWVETCK